jgi:hypothetical protein
MVLSVAFPGKSGSLLANRSMIFGWLGAFLEGLWYFYLEHEWMQSDAFKSQQCFMESISGLYRMLSKFYKKSSTTPLHAQNKKEKS